MKMKNKKPRIMQIQRNDKDKINKLIIKDTVKKVGGSGYLIIPLELSGEYILADIEIIKDKKEKNKNGKQ